MDIKLRADKWVTNNKDIKITDTDDGIKVEYLSDKSYDYIHYEKLRTFSSYSNKDLFDIKKGTIYNIIFDGYSEGECSCNLFINTYSKQKQLSNNYVSLGKELEILIDKEVESYKIAIRFQGKGCVYINNIDIKEGITEKAFNIVEQPEEKYILVTNIYPSKNNLYRNMFVHRRVKLYKQYGLNVDVLSLDTKSKQVSRDNFDGVDIIRGNYEVLEKVLKKTKYKKILIHFIMKEMIDVIDKICYNTPRIVWLHGFEAMKWNRRIFNYTDEEILNNYRMWNERDRIKLRFLDQIYKDDRYTFIPISNWLKSSCCEIDARCKIKNSYVIPNVIDENLFKYNQKNEDDRLKILSIRPFVANNYANDLTVNAILELSKKDFFYELQFNIYGEGKLFKEITEPIKHFVNIHLYEKFITQEEIANLHKTHGIFLCPSRLDTQGVSMCEAMSSGLVCISNNVAAISEFLIDRKCGILARENDYFDIADAIEYLYYNKDIFLNMSKNASLYIRQKCGIESTVKKEIEIITT